jgi:sugar O-acyltransferase (sialic acid O-acetyltransferase NeuD family)
LKCIAVYGASGMGREVMPLVREQYGDRCAAIVFVDDAAADGNSILGFDEFSKLPHSEKFVTIAIANSKIRERLSRRCADAGIQPLNIQATNAVVMSNVEIGEGGILCSFTHITSDIRIGRHFHANYYSYVAHDCVIGDFVTFAPGAKCNGNVHIGDHAYVGSGAMIKQGTRDKPRIIGAGATIGMGAVVTSDVAPGATVVGNPARALQN